MSTQRHAILRQTLELAVPPNADAWPLQEAARRAQAGIERALEHWCDALSAPDRLHRIPRLELDLGTLEPGMLEEELVARVGAALRERLGAAIAGLEADGSAPRVESQWELLAQYLRLGRLPWWADVGARGQPQASLALLLGEAPDMLRGRIAPLLGDAQALRRLAGDFGDEALARLATLLLPRLGGLPGALARTLVAAGRDVPGAGTAAWRRRVWQVVLGNAVPAAAAVAGALDFSRGVVRRLGAGEQRGDARLVRRALALAETAGATGDAARLAEVLRQLTAEPAGPPPAPAGDGRPAPRNLLPAAGRRPDKPSPPDRALDAGRLPPAARDAPGADAPVAPQADPPHPPWAAPAGPAPDADEDVVPVATAGLVILWPFVNTFLERVGLVRDKAFVDDAARARAAVLLHCLASGEGEAPEYLLPLPKALCGLPLDAPVEEDEPPRDAEIEECERLLAAVIGQVPVLNKMSVGGFRASFLLRGGMLGVRDGAWLLRVERATHDLVLDRFPWGFEWVKLPWMQANLHVEW